MTSWTSICQKIIYHLAENQVVHPISLRVFFADISDYRTSDFHFVTNKTCSSFFHELVEKSCKKEAANSGHEHNSFLKISEHFPTNIILTKL